MAATLIGNSPYGTAITLTITLDGLATGAAAISSAFACPSDAAGTYYDVADLEINLGAATALGTSGNPAMSAVVIVALDGTNYEAAYMSGNQLYPIPGQRTYAFAASVTEQIVSIKDIPLYPSATIEVAIANNLGVALPSTGVTATLYPRMSQAG